MHFFLASALLSNASVQSVIFLYIFSKSIFILYADMSQSEYLEEFSCSRVFRCIRVAVLPAIAMTLVLFVDIIVFPVFYSGSYQTPVIFRPCIKS
jgi:hypothetical protein